MTIVLTGENFEETIKEGLTLVDFWAEWCGPCQQMLPVLDDFATAMEGKMKVAKVNVDDAPAIAAKYRVMSIPTMILFKDGEIVDTPLVGVQAKDALEEFTAKYL